jgi:type IV pilus secretin PilQ/predicted competence protein
MKNLSLKISALFVIPAAIASAQIAPAPAASPTATLVPSTSGAMVPTGVPASTATPETSAASIAPAPAPAVAAPATTEAPVGDSMGTNPSQPAPIEPPVQEVVPPPAATQSPVAGAPGATAMNIDSMASSNDGHPVTEFQDQEIATAIRLLARQAKISIAVSDKVQGSVTIRLEDKTPIEAIQIICQMKNLFLDNLQGVYYVKTQDEKAKEPTISQSYTFSYAQAKDISPLLASQFSEATPQIDARTNTVFYHITKSNVDLAKMFLATVDKPTQQVMIEARLVEVTANPKQSYGINWAGVLGSSSSPQTFRYGGTTTATSTVNLQTNPTTGQVTPVTVPSGLPAITQSSTGQLQGNDLLLNGYKGMGGLLRAASGQLAILSVPQMSLTMRLLNEDSDAEFLANPRVVTANNEKATIKITRNQPVPQLNFNEQTATAVFGGFEDKTYGNTLEVLPSINKDNFVTLGVKPEISNKVGDATFTFAGATVASPIIDTRTLDSNVLIKSGDTLAIGGLLQDEVTKGRTKVPVLGDVPVIGYMFQERLNTRTKRNLLVFVTPTIIKQGYGTGLEDQVTGLTESRNEFADPNGWRNNAKGAIRLVPTSTDQLTSEYPAPGTPVNYHVNANNREK